MLRQGLEGGHREPEKECQGDVPQEWGRGKGTLVGMQVTEEGSRAHNLLEQVRRELGHTGKKKQKTAMQGVYRVED